MPFLPPSHQRQSTEVDIMWTQKFFFVKLLVWQPPGLPDLFRRPWTWQKLWQTTECNASISTYRTYGNTSSKEASRWVNWHLTKYRWTAEYCGKCWSAGCNWRKSQQTTTLNRAWSLNVNNLQWKPATNSCSNLTLYSAAAAALRSSYNTGIMDRTLGT